MRSVKMTDRGGMDAHLPVGSAGSGVPAASCDDGRSYTARGEIEGAGRGASTHLHGLAFGCIDCQKSNGESFSFHLHSTLSNFGGFPTVENGGAPWWLPFPQPKWLPCWHNKHLETQRVV